MTLKPIDHISQYALEAHLVRHLAENEADQFMVPQSFDALIASFDPTIWGYSPLHGGTWQRVWAHRDGLDIRAHVVVTGNVFAPHRCTLGMGVERGWRRKGIGRRLMEAALAWTREQPSLVWVDGQALTNNAPVLELDHSVGFVGVGHIPDVARFGDRKVGQLQLVLSLDAQRNQ